MLSFNRGINLVELFEQTSLLVLRYANTIVLAVKGKVVAIALYAYLYPSIIRNKIYCISYKIP